MQPVSAFGSFLVRDYKAKPSDYFLSVRDTDSVKHYWIHRLEYGEFCISVPLTFKTVPDLVLFYSHQVGRLCETLKSSCSRYLDAWEIKDRNFVKFPKMLETDEIYDVWEGSLNGSLVTIKSPRKGLSVANFFQEIEVLKQLKHEHIVRLLGVRTQDNPLYMITQYVDYENQRATECGQYGNLLVYLRRKGEDLTISQLTDMAIQIASAMHYLGDAKCIHRNLQAKNIAVRFSQSQGFACKVNNFSLAKIISEDDHVKSTDEEELPVKWTAPESLRTKRFTFKSDVWSFGIVLNELFTHGDDPYSYPGLHKQQSLLEKLDTGYRMPCPTGCPVSLHKIMTNCWREDPDSRPSFRRLKKTLVKLISVAS